MNTHNYWASVFFGGLTSSCVKGLVVKSFTKRLRESDPVVNISGVQMLVKAPVSQASAVSFGHPEAIVGGLAAMSVILFVAAMLMGCIYQKVKKRWDENEEVEVRDNDPMDHNTCMLAILSLTRDSECLASGQGALHLRSAKIAFAVGLLILTFAIQIAAVQCTKVYVIPQRVYDIRSVYDDFEFAMYGSDETHTTRTKYGEHRGIAEYFRPELFETFNREERAAICNVPFSQVFFFALVLFMWSLTCFAKLKKCLEIFLALILSTRTIKSMEHALEDDIDDMNKESNLKIIVGLTMPLKIAMSFVIFLPWALTTLAILWLGCRWLAATNDYGELILNAVALEFILQMKELVYHATASERSKRDLANTLIAPSSIREKAGFSVFFGGAWPGTLAFIWLYVFLFHAQTVLPDYNWDVHGVCNDFLRDMLLPLH